jgi:tetratricopeptide (TPR) repeat protein
MIELVTLGHPAVLRDRASLSVRPESPAFLTLVYLSMEGPTSEPDLRDLFWPEAGPEEGLRALTRALDELTDALGPGVVKREGGQVRVDQGRVVTDVDRFREAAAGGRHQDALSLYRGPFLGGIDLTADARFRDWARDLRRSLAEVAREARLEAEVETGSRRIPWPKALRQFRSRRVFHVAVLYLGFAWGSLEVCSTLVQMELLGTAAFTALLGLHLAAFPLTVAVTWVLEEARSNESPSRLPGILGQSGLQGIHLVALMGVLAVGSGMGWLALTWGGTQELSASLPEDKHLVVLPFEVEGEASRTRDLADGLVATLARQLEGVAGLQGSLRVVPASEVRSRGVRTPEEARAAFGANLAASGRIREGGDSIRVTLTLLGAEDGRVFRRVEIVEAAAELARLQQTILWELGTLLDLNLAPRERAALAAGGTRSSEAFAFQVQGRAYLDRYERDENLDYALDLFRAALDEDPGYALALAGIGEAYKRKFDRNGDPGDLERGREAVTRALELDDRIAQVHVTLGLIESAVGRHEEALAAFRRAQELEPHSYGALQGIGSAFLELGRSAEAEAFHLEAIDARPGHWALHNSLGVFYFRVGRFREAAEQFRRVVALTPDNVLGWSNLGAILFLLEDWDASAQAMERSLSIAAEDEWALSNLGTLYFFRLGRYEDAAEVFERALEINPRDVTLWYNLANSLRWVPGREARTRFAFQRTMELARDQRDLNPRDPSVILILASCHSYFGDPDRARILVRDALGLAPDDVVQLARAATILEEIGDRDEAIRLLREALDRGYSRELVERAPGLRELRSDPRFAEAAIGVDRP